MIWRAAAIVLGGCSSFNARQLTHRQSMPAVTLDAMHSDEMTKMQQEGFTSQLTTLDSRFGWAE